MMFTTLGLAAKSKRGHFGILNENMKLCLKIWISAWKCFLGSQIFFSVWWKCFRINYGWYPENGCGLRLGQIARDARTSKQFEKKYPVMKSTSVWSDAVLEFSLWLNRALVLCYLSFFWQMNKKNFKERHLHLSNHKKYKIFEKPRFVLAWCGLILTNAAFLRRIDTSRAITSCGSLSLY